MNRLESHITYETKPFNEGTIFYVYDRDVADAFDDYLTEIMEIPFSLIFEDCQTGFHFANHDQHAADSLFAAFLESSPSVTADDGGH